MKAYKQQWRKGPSPVVGQIILEDEDVNYLPGEELIKVSDGEESLLLSIKNLEEILHLARSLTAED